MPYVQRLPNRLLRSEWATRIASELRVDEPVLREALRRAAIERRSEVKPKAELLAPVVKPAERRLIQMLVEAEGFREKLALEIVIKRAASGTRNGKNHRSAGYGKVAEYSRCRKLAAGARRKGSARVV